MPSFQKFTLSLITLLSLLHCQTPPEEKAIQNLQNFITYIETQRYVHHYTPPLDSIERIYSKHRQQLDSLVPLFSEEQKQIYQDLILRYQTLYEVLKREIPLTPLDSDVVHLLQLKTSHPITALSRPDSLPYYYRFLLYYLEHLPKSTPISPTHEKAILLLQRWKTYYIDSLQPESLMVIQSIENKLLNKLTQADSNANRPVP